MKINISGLKEGEFNNNFIISPEELDLGEFQFYKDISVSVTGLKYRNQIDLKIKVGCEFKFPCDRCLEDFNYKLEKEFELVYKYSFDGTPLAELNEGSEDFIFIAPNTVNLNIREDVREFILISIPMKKVPEENDGICTFCNKKIDDILNIKRDEEISPVWDKLIKKSEN